MDQWDGYEGQRDRLIKFLDERNVSNPMVLTGDIHLNFANDIKRNFDDENSPTVGTEYVGTSVTSDGEGSGATSPTFPDNPHIKFVNDTRGYVRCTLDPEQWQTEYRAVSVKAPASPATTIATFVTQDGQPGAQPTANIPETNPGQLPDIIRDRIETQ